MVVKKGSDNKRQITKIKYSFNVYLFWKMYMPIVSASQTKIETPMSPPPSAVEIPSSGHSDPRTFCKFKNFIRG